MFLANTSETDDDGGILRGNGIWRLNKTLGSFLCSIKNVHNRCPLGNVVFQSIWKMWIRGPNVPRDKRKLVYNAMTVPVILCSQTRCLPQTPQSILGMRWSSGIISEDLYVRCGTGPYGGCVDPCSATCYACL